MARIQPVPADNQHAAGGGSTRTWHSLTQTLPGCRAGHWPPHDRTPNVAQPPQGPTRWCPERGSGSCRLQPAVADSVVDLFLCPIPGRLGADITAIMVDQILAGLISCPKPPFASVSQLMGCRFREKCSGMTKEPIWVEGALPRAMRYTKKVRGYKPPAASTLWVRMARPDSRRPNRQAWTTKAKGCLVGGEQSLRLRRAWMLQFRTRHLDRTTR